MSINEISKKIKELFLAQVADDYTDIGFLGIIESEIPELSNDPELEKEYTLQALSELLSEGKIRVGNLRTESNGLFLNYWNLNETEIIEKLNKDWHTYFNNPKWDYAQIPIFDLTESYAREIGKYKSDQEKLLKERPN